MRLITLGDSITQGDHNWPRKLANELDCDLINFAIPASQNLLQIQLLQDWLLDNNLEQDDIVIWQIGLSWDPLVRVEYEVHKEKIDRAERLMRQKLFISHYHERQNIIDNKKKVNLLHVSPMLKDFVNENYTKDEAEILQNLLFMFIVIKKLCPRLLVVKGQNDWVSIDNWESMKSFLTKKDIDFLDQSIVDWCRSKELEFMDYIHPSPNSIHIYNNEELIPKLKNLGWI